DERRAELARHREADGGRVVVGQLGEHDPVLRGRLHPCTDVRDQGPDEPDPIVEDPERAEHGVHYLWTSLKMIRAASWSVDRSASVMFSSTCDSHMSRRSSVSATTCEPASLIAICTLRRSTGSVTRDT